MKRYLVVPVFLTFLCFYLFCAPGVQAQKSIFSDRGSGGKDEVKRNNSYDDDTSKEDVKSWSSGNDNDSDGGGFSIWGNSNDDDDDEETEESGGGLFSIFGSGNDDEEDDESEVDEEKSSFSSSEGQESDVSPGLSGKRKTLETQEQMEVYLGRYRENREGKQAIKDAQGGAAKDVIKDRPLGGNSGVFIDNVLVADPRPVFGNEITGIVPSASPRGSAAAADGTVEIGYSSGEYGFNSGAVCIVPPVDPVCLLYDENTEINDALACVEENRVQLEVLYAGAYWCDPGFLDCYYQYLMAYRNCYNCLPGEYRSVAMQSDYIRLSSEYEYWVANCTEEEFPALAEVRRYLRIKSSMLPGLLVNVDENLAADFNYVDTAFGLPFGGANFYSYVMEFAPATVRDTLPAFAEMVPEIRGASIFQELEDLPEAFSRSDFRKLLLRKIGADYKAARRLKKTDRMGAYALGENAYRLAQAMEALVPDDFQVQIWRGLCANFVKSFRGKL